MNSYIFYKPDMDNDYVDIDVVQAMHDTLQDNMPDKVVITYVYGDLKVIKDGELVNVETIDALKLLLDKEE